MEGKEDGVSRTTIFQTGDLPVFGVFILKKYMHTSFSIKILQVIYSLEAQEHSAKCFFLISQYSKYYHEMLLQMVCLHLSILYWHWPKIFLHFIDNVYKIKTITPKYWYSEYFRYKINILLTVVFQWKHFRWLVQYWALLI